MFLCVSLGVCVSLSISDSEFLCETHSLVVIESVRFSVGEKYRLSVVMFFV